LSIERLQLENFPAMNFFKKLFGSNTTSESPAQSAPPSAREINKPIQSYANFWGWFATQAPRFHEVMKNKGDFERDFFAHLAPRLDALREGYWMLAGMVDDNTADLVITAEGQVKNFVFVEELIAAAPPLSGWRFTALKPAINMEKFGVEMNGLKFSSDTISFCAQEDARYPDEIIINLVHQDHTKENHNVIGHGCMIFIDNYLGELNAALMVDQFNILGKDEVQGELIPMEKLLDYLKWRQAEFVEKYDGERRDTEQDGYSVMNAQLQSGLPLVAVVNVDLLQWDRKASHPWMLIVDIGYDGHAHQGMPDAETAELLAEIEDALLLELNDVDGYLNIGRQSTQNERSIYFACREFRKPAKVLDAMVRGYRGNLTLKFDIFKDPYWRTVGHLEPRE
jgi:Family of unknown function (DUF695)